ncbi:MAG: lysophospholipid acyltransferase family protein [Pseudomonadota bacterium]
MARTVHGDGKILVRHRIEAWLAKAAFRILSALGIDRASGLAGGVMRVVGPLLPHNRVALDNLQAAFPDMGERDRRALAKDMWENFGRTIGEYPFLDDLEPYQDGDRVVVHNAEIIDKVREQNVGTIYFSGHIGNWEVTPNVVVRRGAVLTGIYRATNNPLINDWLIDYRKKTFTHLAPKGTASFPVLMKAVRNRGEIAILMDQKMRESIEVPFFGRPAKTPDLCAKLAIRFGCALVPIIARRTKGAFFEVDVYEPITFEKTGDMEADVEALTTEQNAFLEARIRENPAQWLWMHNRWSPSKRAVKRREATLRLKAKLAEEEENTKKDDAA